MVWLRADPAVLAARVRAGADHRPLLDGGDPEASLTRLLAQREPLYCEVSDLAVDVDHVTPEQVVDAILTSTP